MNDAIHRYEDPLIFIPMAAMFVIIFGIVLRSLREMPLFAGGAKAVIALCVTILAMYGMDQTLVRVVVGQYTAMGVAMLFGLAGLLLAAWIGLTVKTRRRLRRSRQDDEGRE
jgi:hypothetical protein